MVDESYLEKAMRVMAYITNSLEFIDLIKLSLTGQLKDTL